MATLKRFEAFKWCEVALSLKITEIRYKMVLKPLPNVPIDLHETIFVREEFDNNILRLHLPDLSRVTLNIIPGEPFLATCQGMKDESIINDVVKSLSNHQFEVVSCKMCHIECDIVVPSLHQQQLIPNQFKDPHKPRNYFVKDCRVSLRGDQRARVFASNSQQVKAFLTYLKHRVLDKVAIIEFPH